jgi:hypothetical protein
MQDDTRQTQQAPPKQKARAVYEEKQTLYASVAGSFDLVIRDAHIPQKPVVRYDALAELDDARLVLIVEIAFHEAFGQLDHLTESKVLARRAIQAACGLDHLDT